MRIDSSEPGYIVSGAAHLILLLATLFAFSRTAKFEDAQESVPVQVITAQQFNQIAKGEKTAAKTLPKPTRRIDRVAKSRRARPRPPIHVAKRDVATPPPPPQRPPLPARVPTPPAPPQKVAQTQPRPVPKPPAVPPLPPARPEPKLVPQRLAQAQNAPLPPPRPTFKRPAAKADAPPAPLPPARPHFNQIEKVAQREKLDDLIKTADAQPAPRETRRDARERLDPDKISRLLSHDTPQARDSTGQSLTKMASLGGEHADAPRMSPSMWGALDGILQGQYKKCWSYLGLNVENSYVPKVSVVYNADGSLAAPPSLINPPSDPSMRSLAESALRAVRECNPLRIPAQFAPYFNQWKARILRFDPAEMSG